MNASLNNKYKSLSGLDMEYALCMLVHGCLNQAPLIAKDHFIPYSGLFKVSSICLV